MRLLIYGFGPYRRFNDNITEKIIKALPKKRGLKKIVFPVRFHKTQFTHAVKKYRPDVILGLGQSSKRRRLSVEKRAANRMRKNNRGRPEPVVSGGAKWLRTTLALKNGPGGRFSSDAGDYVCNYSMYVILDHLKREGLQTPFGFVHIPHRYSPAKAGRYVQRIVRGLERSILQSVTGY